MSWDAPAPDCGGDIGAAGDGLRATVDGDNAPKHSIELANFKTSHQTRFEKQNQTWQSARNNRTKQKCGQIGPKIVCFFCRDVFFFRFWLTRTRSLHFFVHVWLLAKRIIFFRNILIRRDLARSCMKWNRLSGEGSLWNRPIAISQTWCRSGPALMRLLQCTLLIEVQTTPYVATAGSLKSCDVYVISQIHNTEVILKKQTKSILLSLLVISSGTLDSSTMT